MIPAPGSTSAIFAPNPAAIVVFIDPGHGGCLDWGVPNPFDNTVARAEKSLTLAIALATRDRLAAEGVEVVLSRTADSALAGDFAPEFGCTGDPFRDVNGDGQTGFDAEGNTVARDELTARIDLANLSRADVFLSVHINSLTEDGAVYEIAATQTFYTDETAWAAASERLAGAVQANVVTALDGVATYERQDRGVQATNYFVIAPPLTEPTPEEPNVRKRPRGVQMPGVLAEVGSLSHPGEAEVLATESGQSAVADGLVAGIGDYLAARGLAARVDAMIRGGAAGAPPAARPGDGPPFHAAPVDASIAEDGLRTRLTNTGTERWPDDATLYAAWVATDEPYLASPPDGVEPVAVVPALAPGESVEIRADVGRPPDQVRHVLWVTLGDGTGTFSMLGSVPLQLAWEEES